jgi:hypothetical protein
MFSVVNYKIIVLRKVNEYMQRKDPIFYIPYNFVVRHVINFIKKKSSLMVKTLPKAKMNRWTVVPGVQISSHAYKM